MKVALTLISATCTVALAAGCSSSTPSRSSASPSARSPSHGSSPTPQLAGSVRTVLSPLGLNIHADAAKTAGVVGVAAQGALLTVLDYKSSDSGWYRVQGQTVTGWIVSDPSLTAGGQLTSYQSSRGFSSLYPAAWTFAEEPNDTLFRPQQGSSATIVVRTAASIAAFGQEAPGYSSTYVDDALIVCGYTGKLVEYVQSSGAPAATPNGSSATALQYYADIRLRFDGTHAMQLAFNYSDQKQLQIFEDFYNAITFPYPQCQAPASPAPNPT